MGGDVYANARNGVAVAVDVSASGGASNEASAKVGGDVTAIARVKPGFGGTYGDATGVMLTGGTGYLDVGGNVLAHAYGASAIGVDIYTTGNTTADVHGNVIAIAMGYAMGVHAFTGNVTIDVGGNVYASTGSGPSAYYDTATGVFVKTRPLGSSAHSVNVTVGGNVTAISGDAAHGVNIDASGAVDLHVGGDVLAASDPAPPPTGVIDLPIRRARDGRAYVTGNVSALARESAVGVYVSDQGGSADVEIGKNVYADSTLGAAAGVNEDAADNTKLNVGGNILVKALQFYATGVADEAQGNATVTALRGQHHRPGACTAQLVRTSGGVVGTDIVIHGDVYAKGGFALGVAAYALGNQYVEIDGDVTALATTAGATGVDMSYTVRTTPSSSRVTSTAALSPRVGQHRDRCRGERGRQCDDQHNRPDLRVRPLRLRRLCRQRDRRDPRHHHRRRRGESDGRCSASWTRTAGIYNLLDRRDHDQHPRRLHVRELQRRRSRRRLHTPSGDVSVTDNQIVTKGYNSDGIRIYSTGTVTVDSGTIETFGNNSDGARIYTTGAANVTSGTVVTRGYRAVEIIECERHGYCDCPLPPTSRPTAGSPRVSRSNDNGGVVRRISRRSTPDRSSPTATTRPASR